MAVFNIMDQNQNKPTDINVTVIQSMEYFFTTIPSNILQSLMTEIEEVKSLNFPNECNASNNLVGAIDKQFHLYKNKDILEKFFNESLSQINKQYFNIKTNNQYILNSPKDLPNYFYWVNFQSKGEHNPAHMHDGTLSFVIWIKIPYDLENEKKYHSKYSDYGVERKISRFSFVVPRFYPNTCSLVSEHDIFVDHTYEGKCILFPSYYTHLVTPFYTSDDYRISLSGNLRQI